MQKRNAYIENMLTLTTQLATHAVVVGQISGQSFT